MTIAAVLLAAGGGSRFEGAGHKLLAPWGAGTVVGSALDAALAAGFDEVIVVTGAVDLGELVEGSRAQARVTVVDNPRWAEGQASSVQAGLAVARDHGHEAVVVGLGDQPAVTADAWRRVAAVDAPIVVASFGADRRPPVRLASEVWSLLPATGDEGARGVIATHPELVTAVDVEGDARDVDVVADLLTAEDRAYVEACLGRPPRCSFTVAARRSDGRPTVIANPPFLDDGTPMPTTYWLVDPELNRRIGSLEADGGVNAAEAEIGLDALAVAHARYAAERDALIGADHTGPRPSGGVGGTRIGVKCLHTHYAWYLAGGDDPVGAWVDVRLNDPRPPAPETP